MTREEIEFLSLKENEKEILTLSNQDILTKIKTMTNAEHRSFSYEFLLRLQQRFSAEERIELSRTIGYPVFNRICMGQINHLFLLLQDGAAAIIVNEDGEILLQSRTDNNRWGLPGGCQEVGETFEEVVIREVKEETNLDVTEDNLELIAMVSGETRHKSYPNGDHVYNNTALFCVKNWSGELRWNEESKVMKFFDLDNLPENLHDPDLIERYVEWMKKGK